MAATIKDAIPKIILIPLFGVCLPVISGLITYHLYTLPELIVVHLFFILVIYIIWTGSNRIHLKIRPLYSTVARPFSRMAMVCFVSAILTAIIAILFSFLWMNYSKEVFTWTAINKFIAACVVIVILFTLLYEILILSKEKELDTKIVDQLDRERSQAELQALTNEMDPHFIFNSLNTLNHLISNQPEQARLFNMKLAQVYQYFLINKNKELISLGEELGFIDNYFYLLQIRHDDKLQLQVDLDNETKKAMIPPFAIQVLIENAFKHNEFSELNPLLIKIGMSRQYIEVGNNIKPKSYAVSSTGIGLKNLSSRYKILFQRNIIIQKSEDSFIVKLPII
jgi:LytS/YehU family sensor histidine kinase